MVQTPADPIDWLRQRVSSSGAVIVPGDAQYDERRALLNKVYDKKPAVIVRCAEETDVVAAVRFANAHKLAIAIRSSGASPAGYSVVDGGLVIDLGPLNRVHIDERALRATVGPGLRIGQLIDHLEKVNAAFALGECPDVAVGGLTLGGGISLLGRTLGTTCDNLLEVRLVTAAGDVLTANEQTHADLFWAVRGGGANFGVVTSLTFQLYRIPPKVATSFLTWSIEDAPYVLARATEYFAAGAPDELGATFALVGARSSSAATTAVAEARRGLVRSAEITGPRLVAFLVFNGAPRDAQRWFNVVREVRPVAAEAPSTSSYFEFIRAHFPAVPADFHQYPRSGFVSGALSLTDATRLVAAYQTPSDTTSVVNNIVFFEFTGGAVNRKAPGATAFVHRTSTLALSVWANWMGDRSGEDSGEVAWCNATYEAIKSALNAEVYQNYPDRTLRAFRTAYFGSNLDRLVRIKRKYDPTNRFAFEQGISA